MILCWNGTGDRTNSQKLGRCERLGKIRCWVVISQFLKVISQFLKVISWFLTLISWFLTVYHKVFVTKFILEYSGSYRYRC